MRATDSGARCERTSTTILASTARSEVTPSDCVRAQEFRIFCRTSSASSLVRSVQSITRFSRKTFSLYAVCARRLSIQSIQYSSYPSSSNRSYPAHKFLHLCEVPRSSDSATPANRARASSKPANFTFILERLIRHQSRVSY